MKTYAIGVDLGGTTVKLGLFKTTGELIDKWEIKTNTKDNGSWILPDIAETINKKLEKESIKKDDVQGVGIGVPGAVLPNGVVNRCVNLGWDVVPIEEQLSKLTGLTVKAGNDANVAALGEYWKGSGEDYSSIVLVTLGTGVGGGIIINGRMLVGFNGAGGEIGHINVNPDETLTCGCGNHGCLEQYASATGVVRMAHEALESSKVDSVMRTDNNLTAKDIFDYAKKGDALALSVVDKSMSILGRALAAIANTVNPEAIIIGGGLSKNGPIVLEHIRPSFDKYAFHAVRNTKILLASLTNDAGIYGCAKLVIGGE